MSDFNEDYEVSEEPPSSLLVLRRIHGLASARRFVRFSNVVIERKMSVVAVLVGKD